MKIRIFCMLVLLGMLCCTLVACNGFHNAEDDSEVKEEQASKEEVYYDMDAACELIDFIVEVEGGREPIVLQLTDVQIIDSSQKRTPDRLAEYPTQVWDKANIEENCFNYITEIIQKVKPDLILMTGDQVYGEFDDDGTMLQALVGFMESFGIPWAPVLGNHDAESKMGVDWQCQQYENAEHCLFKQNTISGNGNYTVGIKQDGNLKRVFFMMDSHGCSGMGEESLQNGHTVIPVGFKQDQMEWYEGIIKELKVYSADTKISFAFHIQPKIFAIALDKYGYSSWGQNGIDVINIDMKKNKEESDFGYVGAQLKTPWDNTYKVWESFKTLGVDSIFVGHEHLNNASVVYEGIRCQYGTKSSTYDRYKMVGGTIIPLSEKDGALKQPYVYLCDVK